MQREVKTKIMNSKNSKVKKNTIVKKDIDLTINIFDEIEKIIIKDKRFVKDDKTIDKIGFRNAVNSLDELLLKEFYKNKYIKNRYFKKVCDLIVFDKTEFMYLFENIKFLGDSYTRFKDDIGLIDKNEKFIVDNDDVVLSFPFKDCMLEFDSTDVDDDREEYFINERISKEKIDVMFENKVFTDVKKIDKDGEKVIDKFDINDNLLIKGNNLLAMHTLLPVYEGKIKLMYWDILYNTKSDKVPYANSFKHSSWLVMMKNRLKVAYDLLKEDGAIFLQCDYHEMAYLKVLCDEIFENGYISTITVKTSSESGVKVNSNKPIKTAEYILLYSKNKDLYNYKQIRIKTGYDSNYKYFVDNPNDDILKWKITSKIKDKYNEIKSTTEKPTDEELRQFQIEYKNNIFSVRDISDSLKDYIKDNKINKEKVFKYTTSTGKETLLYKNGEIVFVNKKIFTIDGKEELTKIASDIWTDISWDGIAKEGGVRLKNGKKPEKLLERIISSSTEINDIVLDAYFGTGTTGTVAIQMQRQFIGIEQLNEHIEYAKTRIDNCMNGNETSISKQYNWQGGGSFVYLELAKLNQNFIDKISKVPKTKESELIDIYNDIKNNAYLNCYIDTNKIDVQTEKFNKLNFLDKKKFLIELLDKNQLYVNLMDIDDAEFNISDNDKKFTKSFYEKGN